MKDEPSTPDPRWVSSDLPREGEVEVKVECVAPAETIERARVTCEAIAQAMLHQRHWDHIVESALIEERLAVHLEYTLRAEAAKAGVEVDASEAPTIKPHHVTTPSGDTGYSDVRDEEVEIVFDLFDGIEPSDPPAGSSPIIPTVRRPK